MDIKQCTKSWAQTEEFEIWIVYITATIHGIDQCIEKPTYHIKH